MLYLSRLEPRSAPSAPFGRARGGGGARGLQPTTIFFLLLLLLLLSLLLLLLLFTIIRGHLPPALEPAHPHAGVPVWKSAEEATAPPNDETKLKKGKTINKKKNGLMQHYRSECHVKPSDLYATRRTAVATPPKRSYAKFTK